MDAELRECAARLAFVRAVVEKRLVVANAEDDELLAGLIGLGLPKISEGEGLKGYEYLLKMRIDRIKASAVQELEAEHSNGVSVREKLYATSPEMLWLTDLEEFSSAWAVYTASRNTAYTSVGNVSEGKKAGGRKPAKKSTKL